MQGDVRGCKGLQHEQARREEERVVGRRVERGPRRVGARDLRGRGVYEGVCEGV